MTHPTLEHGGLLFNLIFLTLFFTKIIICISIINMSAVPQQINYTSILPLAVESRSRRRSFLPTNGQLFNSAQNNVIRINVMANAFLDTKESYVRMRLTNTGGQTLGFDFGGGSGIVQRLRVLQQGRVLSDVQNYNKLLSAILLPAQGNETHVATRSVTEGVKYANSGPGAGGNMGAATQAEVNGATINTPTNANDMVPIAGEFVFCFPLVNGLLGSTQDKLVPLQLLGSAPLEVEITLAPSLDIGCWGGAAPGGYQIDDIRYMASLVEVGPEVDQHLREVQAASGGRLVLNGTDYTNYTGNISAGALGQVHLNIPTRRKSLKSVLFVGGSQSFGAPAPNQNTRYNMSFGGNFNMVDYQLKVGNTFIPQIPIDCDYQGGGFAFARGEALEELGKCFGSVGGTHGLGVITRINYATADCDVVGMSQESNPANPFNTHVFCPMGIDLEAFQPGDHGEGSGALESGIDTASRSLDVALNLTIGAANGEPIVVNMYAVYDSIYWIDQEGNLQVSI